jgi:hypothetical protein
VQHAYAAGARGVPVKYLSKYSPSREGARGWWTLIAELSFDSWTNLSHRQAKSTKPPKLITLNLTKI